MKIRKIDLQSIDGFKIGNAEDIGKGTGCTVIVCEDGAVAGVDVRGGAPATRETDLLRSENTVNTINAVVISGGSAFGLESGSGVMRELAERGIGYDTGVAKIPIVCGASLYDLNLGDSSYFPDVEMGRQACRNAYEGKFEHGNHGAGTGASVGKFAGITRAMKTGLGIFACADEYVKVGAVTAVNAMGDIYNGAGNIIAGFRDEDGTSIHGTIKSLKSQVHNEKKNDSEPSGDGFVHQTFDEISKNKSEIAEAIKNAFSNKINETTEAEAAPVKDMMITGHYPKISDKAADRAVKEDIEKEIKREKERETEKEEAVAAPRIKENDENVLTVSSVLENKISDDDSDMGYDVSFNTTISCLITNAKLSKSQANKLASILHDAYARAIKPVHSTMDGDTIFVMTTNKQEVNFDAFAALATDVLQYAIIDAALSARSAYGLPAACDIIK